jgi:pimeloyl-ACP methyl ester carboxylesterase
VRSLELLGRAGVPVVAIEPAGHWPFVDQLDASAAAIAELLRAWS